MWCFKKYTLLPWRSILNNIAFGLEIKKINKKERHRVARKFLDLVGLSDYADALPYELSGGMQQRGGRCPGPGGGPGCATHGRTVWCS